MLHTFLRPKMPFPLYVETDVECEGNDNIIDHDDYYCWVKLDCGGQCEVNGLKGTCAAKDNPPSEKHTIQGECKKKFCYCWINLDDQGGIGNDCKDQESQECKDLANKGYCYSFYGEWMMRFCRKSCKACDTTCQNNPAVAALCPGWASQYCKKNANYTEWMTLHCRKSCNDMFGGFCDKHTCEDGMSGADCKTRKCTTIRYSKQFLN